MLDLIRSAIFQACAVTSVLCGYELAMARRNGWGWFLILGFLVATTRISTTVEDDPDEVE